MSRSMVSQDLKSGIVSVLGTDLELYYLHTHVVGFFVRYKVRFDPDRCVFVSTVLCKEWNCFFDVLSDMFKDQGGSYNENNFLPVLWRPSEVSTVYEFVDFCTDSSLRFRLYSALEDLHRDDVDMFRVIQGKMNYPCVGITLAIFMLIPVYTSENYFWLVTCRMLERKRRASYVG